MSRYPNNPNVRTVYLGKYTRETANAIAGELEDGDIYWWYKAPGFLSQIWEFDTVRLFVDREHLDEAKAVAERIQARNTAGEGA
ncbi:MAG: hypothetical protein WD757_08985 [Actinomycetota bacterium]